MPSDRLPFWKGGFRLEGDGRILAIGCVPFAKCGCLRGANIPPHRANKISWAMPRSMLRVWLKCNFFVVQTPFVKELFEGFFFRFFFVICGPPISF